VPKTQRVYRPDELTPAELRYLRDYYPDQVEERHDRLRTTLKRLTRKGKDPQQLHWAMIIGMRQRYAHDHVTSLTNKAARRKRSQLIASTNKHLDRALAGLRQLLPPMSSDSSALFGDDDLLRMRSALLQPSDAAPERRHGGRPWHWKQATEQTLKDAGVGKFDRRELVAALFLDSAE
jgi:hypothetical protein